MPSKRKTSKRKTSSSPRKRWPWRSPVVTRSVSRRRAQTKKKKTAPKLRMKSMAFITGPRMWSGEFERVGQIVAVSRDGQKYALRMNYNGLLILRNKKDIRLATTAEKKHDPKLHRHEATINHAEREWLNK